LLPYFKKKESGSYHTPVVSTDIWIPASILHGYLLEENMHKLRNFKCSSAYLQLQHSVQIRQLYMDSIFALGFC